MSKKLTVYIGEYGKKSRVLYGDEQIQGVTEVAISATANDMSVVRITVYARDCEIIHQDFQDK